MTYSHRRGRSGALVMPFSLGMTSPSSGSLNVGPCVLATFDVVGDVQR